MENKRTIYNIQILRFVAAALVVLAHAEIFIYDGAKSEPLGGFGVDIFFVISGFIIPYIAYRGIDYNGKFKVGSINFFLRRIVRVVPLYAISTAICVFFAYLVSYKLSNPTPPVSFWWPSTKIDMLWYIDSITFTHWNRPPILGVGWTLQYEFLFYAFFSLFIAVKLSKIEYVEVAFITIIVLSNMLLSYSGTSWFIHEYAPFINLTASPIMIEFAMGMLLYRLYISNALLCKGVSLTILVLFIPGFYVLEKNMITTSLGGDWHRPLVWGFFAFYGVWAAISLEGKIKAPKFIVFLGNASYSIYLMHALITAWMAHIFVVSDMVSKIGIYGYYIIYFTLSCALGSIAHICIEKPIARHLRRFF
ncbi:acyltransferase family protein [Proteus mirabilis]|uniref:acyltransferase family protein n=1 Tax=Proteus mirabilis TaxID=584 RepID=UPI00299C9ED4|nr:acyltransferase [Proteus mirabilis]HDA9903848.1 acyltransferase [Proteus mirabilis]HEH4212243.1 acyltransferase [Proteus mirabilis]